MNTKYNYNKDIVVDHPFSEEKIFWDLVERYHKFGSLYIGVDFDDTLYPFRGHRQPTVIVDLLKRAKKAGFTLCLYTLPLDDENLAWKIQWCKDQGIEMDYVNSYIFQQ